MPTPVSTIAHLISLAIAPVFLLAGIGAILGVITQRLARVVDRIRSLEDRFDGLVDGDRERARDELKVLARRLHLANNAVGFCTAAALFICLVVAVLFVADLVDLNFGRWIAMMFVSAMGLLVTGLVLFLLEIRLAAKSLRVRPDLLREEFVDRSGGLL